MATYNKSKIMKRAWDLYKNSGSFPTYSGRKRFAECLRSAWRHAHSEVTRAFYAAQAEARKDMSQIKRLQEKVSLLQFKSTRYDIAAERRRLEDQIERLAA